MPFQVAFVIDEPRRRSPNEPKLAADPMVQAALAGATAMLDVSDGLVLDARRLAVASGCTVRLDPAAIAREARALNDLDAVVSDHASHFVLAGGEDHALLATFPPGVDLPEGFRRLGEIVDDIGVCTTTRRPVKAVQVGGPLCAYFPRGLFVTPLDYAAISKPHDLLVHAGITVFDNTAVIL